MIWKDWDDTRRANTLRITGIVIASVTAFIFLACFSYLFHWKEDMSLLNSGLTTEAAKDFSNKAGSLGNLLGRGMVAGLFGLGSFAIVFILAILSIRLIAKKWLGKMTKTVLVAVFSAIISSIALSYIGHFIGLENAFGNGLGGNFGRFITDESLILFGDIITGVFILVLIVCLLFFSSRRFTEWFASLFKADSGETITEAAPMQINPTVAGTVSDSPDVEPEPEKPAPEIPAPVRPEPTPAEKPVVSAPTQEADPANFEIIDDPDGLNTTVSKPLEPIDNRLDPPDGLPKFKTPSLDLLDAHSSARKEVSSEELTTNNNKIRAALANYKIQINEVKAIVGPTVTLYKVYPAPGVQISQIKRLQEDIALSLNAKGVRVVTLSDSVGIEVANNSPSIVPLRALLNDDSFRSSKYELPVAIGYTITQKVKVFDLSDAPHLLVAGATKQGKSVGLNVIVSSLLYSRHPSELKFVFIDPKMVEFSAYAQLLKHYLAVLPDAGSEEDEKNSAIVKNPKNAERILRSLCQEMDDRYELLSKAGVNKITLYNEKYKKRHLLPSDGHRFLPYLVCVVDEYADLTMSIGGSPETRAASKSITNSIIRLAQKGRAAGLHVILATQRPSVDVISGLIKSNFPMRIAFRVASRTDSMTILDAPGAEKLIGKGDMLFSAGIESERIQCGYVSGEEIDAITEFIGEQQGYAKSYNTPYYLPIPADANSEGSSTTDMSDLDERFVEAAELVVTTQKASTSYLQTRLGMGFAKAARVMGQLEAAGIVGPQEGAKPRQILIPDLNSLQPILDSFVK